MLSKISLQKGVEHAEWGTKDRNIASNWSQENVVNTYGTSCLMQFDKNRGEREREIEPTIFMETLRSSIG